MRAAVRRSKSSCAYAITTIATNADSAAHATDPMPADKAGRALELLVPLLLLLLPLDDVAADVVAAVPVVFKTVRRCDRETCIQRLRTTVGACRYGDTCVRECR